MKERLAVLIFCFLATFALSAQQSVIDLSTVDFDKTQSLRLSGKWEFYWNQLLEPKDFLHPQNLEWMNVPRPWNRDSKYPALGFATYRTTIKLQPTIGLVLYFPVVNSAATFWVNGVKINSVGKVGSAKETHFAKLASTMVELPAMATKVEVVIQVSNFTYAIGGFSETPTLGKTSAILLSASRAQGIENFFAGSLIAMFIYQIILYFLFYRGKPYLWLALICLGAALRAMIMHGGSFLLPNLFPDVPWEFWKKIEFGCVYATMSIFPLYIYYLFRERAPVWPLKFFVPVSILQCLITIVTPQYFYGMLLEITHLSFLLGFIYAGVVIGRAWKAGSNDAKIIFFGVLASFPFIFLEILRNSVFVGLDIQFMYLVELGVLVFLLFQVYLLANHYAKAYKGLELMNQNLERLVEERSSELVSTSRLKDRLLSVMSHDIKSPLNSLRGILAIYNKGKIDQSEFSYYFKRIEGDLSKTSLLVDNILYWKAAQLKGVEVRHEKFEVGLLIKENTDLFQTIAHNKSVLLTSVNLAEGWIVFDRNILNMLLRNLISNAIKFSDKGDEIKILFEQRPSDSVIKVVDKGVGMNQELIEILKNPIKARSRIGTNQEEGTGIGLSFSLEYLEKAGGKLEIESEVGKGSVFTIVIPNL